MKPKYLNVMSGTMKVLGGAGFLLSGLLYLGGSWGAVVEHDSSVLNLAFPTAVISLGIFAFGTFLNRRWLISSGQPLASVRPMTQFLSGILLVLQIISILVGILPLLAITITIYNSISKGAPTGEITLPIAIFAGAVIVFLLSRYFRNKLMETPTDFQ